MGGFLSKFTAFYWVLPCFTELYLVLLGFLLGFIGFYLVLQGLTTVPSKFDERRSDSHQSDCLQLMTRCFVCVGGWSRLALALALASGFMAAAEFDDADAVCCRRPALPQRR